MGASGQEAEIVNQGAVSFPAREEWDQGQGIFIVKSGGRGHGDWD